MISVTGERIVRRVTLHWQGSNRGARSSTVPNNDRSLPWPPILQRPLSTTSRAASPDLAVLLGLRLNKMALQAGQDRLGLCERQSQRRRRAAGRGAAAGVHLMHLLGANCAGQLHHPPPLHPASLISVIRPVLPRSARYPPPFGRSPTWMVPPKPSLRLISTSPISAAFGRPQETYLRLMAVGSMPPTMWSSARVLYRAAVPTQPALWQ